MALGDLGAPLDTDEFYTTDLLTFSFLHVSGDCYAIAFEDVNHKGQVVSKFILADGTISNAYEDILEFDSGACNFPNIIHVSGNVFAIVYQGVDTDGFLVTLSIDAAGTISNAVLDSYEFDTGNTYHPRIKHVSGNVYAIFYQSATSAGTIATLTIAPNGTITHSIIASGNFAATQAVSPVPVQVAPNVFLTHYRNNALAGKLVTSTIASNGTITAAIFDTLETLANPCSEGAMAHVTGNIFAIVRKSTDNDGFIDTVAVEQDGSIGADWIATFEYDPITGGYPDIVSIGQGIVLVTVSHGGGGDSLVSIQISAIGEITDPILDGILIDASTFAMSKILHIAGNTYAVVYQGPAGDGFMATPTCVTPSAGPAQILPMMGVG